MFSTCLFVCLFVRLSVRLPTILQRWYFKNEWTNFATNWQKWSTAGFILARIVHVKNENGQKFTRKK